MKNPVFLTITTDASFNHQYSVGGYAFRIVSDQQRINHSGIFKSDLSNSLQAELMCIANAIHTVVKSGLKADLVVINTDCQHGIIHIQKNKIELAKAINKLLVKLKESTECEKYFIKHVKAHTSSTKSRNLANGWCDKEAKKKMREAVKIKKQKDLVDTN
jgi:ribonuclease HI